MRKLSISVLLVLASSCSSAPAAKNTSQFQVVNLGPAFKSFWAEAKGKPFEKQLSIWERIIEAPEQSFYDTLVWDKKDLPNWAERRTRNLKKYFVKYPDLNISITTLFNNFEPTLYRQMDLFKKTFPDAKFDIPIYAVPSTTFNGRAGEGGSGHPIVLAFGIDLMADLHSDPGVLYAHELFHVYHEKFLRLDAVLENDKHLTLPLWMEGFASYVSQQMNPEAAMSSVFMSDELPKIDDIAYLARKFIDDANTKSFDPSQPQIYQKWFNAGAKIKIRADLPERCGYLLGYYVVKQLAKTHSVEEMVRWDVNTSDAHVKEALRAIIANPKLTFTSASPTSID